MGVSSLMKAAFPIGFISSQSGTSTSDLAAGGNSTAKGMVPPAALNKGSDTYKLYSGDGDKDWPGMDQWVSFYEMWEQNEVMINSSCDALGYSGVPNPTSEELDGVLDAIAAESKESGLDQRFILAVVMQESKGCVRAKSTESPGDAIHNPGLMQTHNGKGSCNEDGDMQDPCPDSEIKQMVKDGVSGTDKGDGLKQVYGRAKGSGAAQYYRAARMYNSGSIDPSGDLGKGCCTKCYASDIANRLTGWVQAQHDCDLDGETSWWPMAHVPGTAHYSGPSKGSSSAQQSDTTTSSTTQNANAADAHKSTQWDGDDGMWHGNQGDWDNGQWKQSSNSWSAGGSGSSSGSQW